MGMGKRLGDYTNLMKSPESKLNSIEFPEKYHVSHRLKGIESAHGG
jgi:hypothetical protein